MQIHIPVDHIYTRTRARFPSMWCTRRTGCSRVRSYSRICARPCARVYSRPSVYTYTYNACARRFTCVCVEALVYRQTRVHGSIAVYSDVWMRRSEWKSAGKILGGLRGRSVRWEASIEERSRKVCCRDAGGFVSPEMPVFEGPHGAEGCGESSCEMEIVRLGATTVADRDSKVTAAEAGVWWIRGIANFLRLRARHFLVDFEREREREATRGLLSDSRTVDLGDRRLLARGTLGFLALASVADIFFTRRIIRGFLGFDSTSQPADRYELLLFLPARFSVRFSRPRGGRVLDEKGSANLTGEKHKFEEPGFLGDSNRVVTGALAVVIGLEATVTREFLFERFS
ncbi:uncharacterized protein [Venturia canescens]|uniref:uncharacterized protein n=1 Tax=Venturia canescens TaxID=32260 RepID=UPI001C9C45B5|nr:uncharacterized protein LOC122413796 [Venturia canescens]